MYEYFAYIGGCFLGLQLIPQIYKTYSQNNADNLSLQFMVCNWIGLTSMGIYGLSNKDTPLVIPIVLSLLNTSILIILKIRIDNQKSIFLFEH